MRLVIAGATGTVGRHVVNAAKSRGHEIVALSRSSGQDIVNGAGLVRAMAGADAVVDVTSTVTTSAAKSTAFFTTVTANLTNAELQAGVTHHVALSIVGIDTVNVGYYAGKLAQERAVREGPAGPVVVVAGYAIPRVRRTSHAPRLNRTVGSRAQDSHAPGRSPRSRHAARRDRGRCTWWTRHRPRRPQR
jgi:uncharacterized protein YbjT (DUF2867 family)